MDTKGWVLRAVEALRYAGEQEILRWLDEEGESLSKTELRRALQSLLDQGKLELKNDLFRLKPKDGTGKAFEDLFKG